MALDCKPFSAAVVGRPSFIREGLSFSMQEFGCEIKARIEDIIDSKSIDQLFNSGISHCFIITAGYEDTEINDFMKILTFNDPEIVNVAVSGERELRDLKWPLAKKSLSSSLSPDAFIAALEMLLSSEASKSAQAQAITAEGDRALSLSASRGRLSRREQDVLDGLQRGESNKHIARRLKLSDATVKIHVRAVLRKTGAENRTQAALWALNNQSVRTRGH